MVNDSYLGVLFIDKKDLKNKSEIDIIEESLEKYRFDHVSNPFCVKSALDLVKEGREIYEDLINNKNSFYSLYVDVFNKRPLCKEKQGMLHVCRDKYPEKDILASIESNCGGIINDVIGILQSDTEKDKKEFYINIFKYYNTQYVYDEDDFAYVDNSDENKGLRIEAYPYLGLDTMDGKTLFQSNINDLDIELMFDKKRKMYKNMYELAKRTAAKRLDEDIDDDSWKDNELVRAIFGLNIDDDMESFVDRKMKDAAPIKSQVMIVDGEWYEYDCIMELDNDAILDKGKYKNMMMKFLEEYKDTHVIASVKIVKELYGDLS